MDDKDINRLGGCDTAQRAQDLVGVAESKNWGSEAISVVSIKEAHS